MEGDLLFFPSYARFHCDPNKHIKIEYKGWVFKNNLTTSQKLAKNASRRILSIFAAHGSTNDAQTYEQRSTPFLAHSIKHARIQIAVLTFDNVEIMSFEVETDGKGIFIGTASIPVNSLEEHSLFKLEAFSIDVPSIQSSASVPVISPTGVSVISDVDDTIKDSLVYRGKISAVGVAMFGEFKEVPGICDTYNYLVGKGARIHYVSAGPYQLLPTLSLFLSQFNFPAGSLNLRSLGTESSSVYKHRVIAKIIQDFPDRRFILVGDSGEQDIEIYERIRAAFPDNIIKVFIRHVGDKSAKDLEERARLIFGLEKHTNSFTWKLFVDSLDIARDDDVGIYV